MKEYKQRLENIRLASISVANFAVEFERHRTHLEEASQLAGGGVGDIIKAFVTFSGQMIDKVQGSLAAEMCAAAVDEAEDLKGVPDRRDQKKRNRYV